MYKRLRNTYRAVGKGAWEDYTSSIQRPPEISQRLTLIGSKRVLYLYKSAPVSVVKFDAKDRRKTVFLKGISSWQGL